MKLKKKYNTPRKQFEALDDLNCFMATFYTFENRHDIDEESTLGVSILTHFNWSSTVEGPEHWHSIHNHLVNIIFE